MEEGGGRDVWASSMNVDEKNGSSGALTPEHWPAQIDAKQYVITRSTLTPQISHSAFCLPQ